MKDFNLFGSCRHPIICGVIFIFILSVIYWQGISLYREYKENKQETSVIRDETTEEITYFGSNRFY